MQQQKHWKLVGQQQLLQQLQPMQQLLEWQQVPRSLLRLLQYMMRWLLPSLQGHKQLRRRRRHCVHRQHRQSLRLSQRRQLCRQLQRQYQHWQRQSSWQQQIQQRQKSMQQQQRQHHHLYLKCLRQQQWSQQQLRQRHLQHCQLLVSLPQPQMQPLISWQALHSQGGQLRARQPLKNQQQQQLMEMLLGSQEQVMKALLTLLPQPVTGLQQKRYQHLLMQLQSKGQLWHHQWLQAAAAC